MKFKVVNTYTGYSEMSIESLKEREASTLEEMHKIVNDEVKALDWYDPEFYGSEISDRMLVENVGTVGYGEENVFIILPETNKMYSKLKVEFADMTESEWDGWVKFCRSLYF
jgi:hypothetical protein